MKNQSDLIFTIAAIVIMLAGVGICYGTKREAVKPAPPEQVNLTTPQLPAGDVVMATALPGASSNNGQNMAMPAAAGRPGMPSLGGSGAPSFAGGPGQPSTPSVGGDLGAQPKIARPQAAKQG